MRGAGPAIVLLAFAACGGPDPTEPPTVRYGVDVCDRCRMIVSDERFAAARWLPDEVAFARYDDIGCLLADLPATADSAKSEGPGAIGAGPDEPLRPIWVHDHGSGEWIDAGTAVFVRAEGLETPMASHLAAFADREAARTFAADFESATILGWEELRSRRAGT